MRLFEFHDVDGWHMSNDLWELRKAQEREDDDAWVAEQIAQEDRDKVAGLFLIGEPQ